MCHIKFLYSKYKLSGLFTDNNSKVLNKYDKNFEIIKNPDKNWESC
jgi:hypothetical protein